MELVCPYCQGHAFVMVRSSDGQTVTVCTSCDQPVPFEAPKEPGDNKPTPGEKA